MDFLKKRWLLLAAGLAVSLCTGIGYTWSVFQSALIKTYGWDIKVTSLIFTLQVAVSTLTPTFFGRFQVKLGTRRYALIGGFVYGLCLIAAGFTSRLALFVLIFGVGVGLGTGMIYPCLMGYGVKIFPDKPGLAAGLLAGSYGAGAVLWAPTAAVLSRAYGIMSVYKIFGAVFFVIIGALSFAFSDPPAGFAPVKRAAKQKAASHPAQAVDASNSVNQSDAADLTPREMVRTARFYLILALFSLGTASGLMIMGHASSILQGILSIDATAAAFLVGVVSVFNALGRVFWGSVSDRFGRFPVISSLFVVVGAAMLALSVFSGAIFVGAIFAVGFCYGGFAALIAPVAADAFGPKHVTVNYGYLFLSYGIGGVFGPQLAAFMKSASGGYHAAFLVVSLFSVIGIALSFAALRPRKATKFDAMMA